VVLSPHPVSPFEKGGFNLSRVERGV